MEREEVVAWLEAYRRAWERADTAAAVGLFTSGACYRSHPLRPAHTGHDGIAAYWDRATAGQRDMRVRLGDPVADGHRVAAEWNSSSTIRMSNAVVAVSGSTRRTASTPST